MRQPIPGTIRRAGRPPFLGPLLGLGLLLAGCGEPRMADRPTFEGASSRVDVFLRPLQASTYPLTMQLAEVHLRGESGVIETLDLETSTISGSHGGRRQALAGATVPSGSYDALLLTVRAAWLDMEGRRVDLQLLAGSGDAGGRSVGPVQYSIPVQLDVRRQDAVAVFLDWNVAGSVADGSGFRPRLLPTLEAPQVRVGLLYVTDAAAGSLLAVSRFSGEVVATIGVGPRPSALAQTEDRRRLFVANAGDGSVSVVDLLGSQTVTAIPLRAQARSADVAIADRLGLAAVANPGLNSVSLLELRSLARVEDVPVGRTPVRLVALPRLRRLFVANADSNDVTVVDLVKRGPLTTIPVGDEPSALAVDRAERYVVVGHRISRDLVVIDAESLAVAGTIHAGANVTALVADRQRRAVFVAMDRPPEIAVADLSLQAVTRRFSISGRVENLVQPRDGPSIYGAAPSRGGLIVVNVITGREEALLPCGSAPSDVVVID